MFYPNILQPKVINNETELDGMPFVAPEAWGGFGLVISLSKKGGIGGDHWQECRPGEGHNSLENLEVDPPVTIAALKVVLLNEFRRNVRYFNVDVFGVWHWT